VIAGGAVAKLLETKQGRCPIKPRSALAVALGWINARQRRISPRNLKTSIQLD
jgi:hypothetical protein